MPMLRRIGIWSICGCAVALIWTLVFYLAGPSNGQYPSQGAVLHYLGRTPLLPATVPVALLGHHYAMKWYTASVINAAMYGCIGMVVETIRLALRTSSARLRH